MARRKTKFTDVFTPEVVAYYYDNPQAFVEDIVFNTRHKDKGGDLYLSEQQIEVLNALKTGKRISIRSGRGIGKDALICFMVLWFMCTRAHPRLVISAPTKKQLHDGLWPELGKWLRDSLIKDLFTWTNSKFYLTEDPVEWFAVAVTATKPESIQGYRAEHFMLIINEASGVSDEIWNAAKGSLTREDNYAILAGNPTQTNGFFADSHKTARELWQTFHFSSEESPFVTREFINDYLMNYGKDHMLYKVHVQGEFPDGSLDSFISLESVMAAVNREVETDKTSEIQIGVDVAHFGDDLTAIAWRHGNKIHSPITKDKTSIPEVTGMTLELVKDIRTKTGYKETIKVCVDATGVGAGVADELALDREHNIEVVPINFGSAGNDQYQYQTSVLWGTFKARIGQLEIPDDPKLISELSSRKYRITPNGKVQIEPKTEYKKRHDKSPDRADAVILTCAESQNESRVLKSFDHLASYIKDFTTMGYIGGGDKLITINYGRDRKYGALVVYYNRGTIMISAEYTSDDSIYALSNWIREIVNVGRVIGNERMFGSYGDDVAAQFRKNSITIYDNYRYDEYGAIELLNQLINEKRILIHSGCSSLISQMRKWNLNAPKNTIEADFNLCYALLNVISELREKIAPRTMSTQFRAYSGQREEAIKSISSGGMDRNAWQYC